MAPGGVQRAHGGRGAGDPGEGRGRRADGRRCRTTRSSMTSDRPHEAILDVAEARGCDLIFIASHGRRGIKGLMLGSQTQKVLQHDDHSGAGLRGREQPAAPSAASRRSPSSATSTARSRRSSTASNSWSAQARDSGKPPSFPLLRAMVHYVKRVSRERCITRRRTRTCSASCARGRSEFDATLDELERQHVDGHAIRRRSWSRASSPTRRIRTTDCPASPTRSSASRRRRCSTWRSRRRSSCPPRASI